VHLFFECVIPKTIWEGVSAHLSFGIGSDYLSIASKWLHKDKFYCVNIVSTAVLRGMWLTRNDFVFKKQGWGDVKLIWRGILNMSMEWRPIYKESKIEMMMSWLSFLEKLIRAPLQIGNV
jgi:hypothetical protein